MRSLWPVLLALGACNLVPPDSELRIHMTEEELNAPPNSNEVKAKLTYDVRVWRELERKLHTGTPECGGLLWREGYVLCKKDETLFEIYHLRSEPVEMPNRVQEKVYFCREEGLYYYHYEGGPRRLNVWLGPYKLDFTKVRPENP